MKPSPQRTPLDESSPAAPHLDSKRKAPFPERLAPLQDWRIEENSGFDVPQGREISFGYLICKKCGSKYPILGGVLILTPYSKEYLQDRVQIIRRLVPEIPKSFRVPGLFPFSPDQNPLGVDESDLESERVNEIYLLNHYVDSKTLLNSLSTDLSDPPMPSKAESIAHHNTSRDSSALSKSPSPTHSTSLSEDLSELIAKYWDYGPLAKAQHALQNSMELNSVLDLGCSLGGLYLKLRQSREKRFIYLGIDQSFSAVFTARSIYGLGAQQTHRSLNSAFQFKFRRDLIETDSMQLEIPHISENQNAVDFIVTDISSPPAKSGFWDLVVHLNTIDMLEKPEELFHEASRLTHQTGSVLFSSPYVWTTKVTEHLHSQVKPESSEYLIRNWAEKAGFRNSLFENRYLPWLFYKHSRQVEFYVCDFFLRSKNASQD